MLIYLFGLIFLISATATKADLTSKFDSSRAFKHVAKQVEFGPRPSGSPELKKTREYLEAELRACGLEVSEQVFTQETPRGNIQFVNILAKVPNRSFFSIFKKTNPKILIASHYDTKWLPKIRFLGANDAGSSTAVLLEVARVIAQAKFSLKAFDIEFVFFDGEEAIETYSSTDGLYGSRHYVSLLKSNDSIKAFYLLDMIGDKDLSVLLPNGHPELSKRIFDASEALGFRRYFRWLPSPIIDDHQPFFLKGIPAVDLIDFEYGPENRWWHTEEDSLDKISPKSLEIVGKTILKVLESYNKPSP